MFVLGINLMSDQYHNHKGGIMPKIKKTSLAISGELHDALWLLRGQKKISSIKAALEAGGWYIVSRGGIPDDRDEIKEVVKKLREGK